MIFLPRLSQQSAGEVTVRSGGAAAAARGSRRLTSRRRQSSARQLNISHLRLANTAPATDAMTAATNATVSSTVFVADCLAATFNTAVTAAADATYINKQK